MPKCCIMMPNFLLHSSSVTSMADQNIGQFWLYNIIKKILKISLYFDLHAGHNELGSWKFGKLMYSLGQHFGKFHPPRLSGSKVKKRTLDGAKSANENIYICIKISCWEVIFYEFIVGFFWIFFLSMHTRGWCVVYVAIDQGIH